jgi:hypothetical protein
LAQLTSFGGVDLESKHRSVLIRRQYLPIAPQKAHPDNGILLCLNEPSLRLRKNSYIHTTPRHLIAVTSLHPYSNLDEEYALSQVSYQCLIDYIGFQVPLVGLHDADIFPTTRTTPAAPQVSSPQAGSIAAVTRNTPRASEPINPPWIGASTTRIIQSRIPTGEHSLPGGTRQIIEHWPPLTRQSAYGTIRSPRIFQSATNATISSTREGQLDDDRQQNRTPSKIVYIFLLIFMVVEFRYAIYRFGYWARWAVGATIKTIKRAPGAAAMVVTGVWSAIRDWRTPLLA